jgi:outer membrane protein
MNVIVAARPARKSWTEMVYISLVALSLSLFLCTGSSRAQTDPMPKSTEISSHTTKADLAPVKPQAERYTLSEAVAFALQNNPKVRISAKDIEVETYGIDAAQAERMPRIDFGSGASRYRYPSPLTPPVISGPFGAGLDIPEYSRNIYEAGGSLRLPIFKGGRLYRAVVVAELKKAIAQDNYVTSKQDLVYNLTSVFYKIAELEKLLVTTDGNVKQLEAHKRDVDLLFKTGAVAYLDLLKTDVQLAYAIEQRIAVKNNLESTYELLKSLMGMDDMERRIAIVYHETTSLLPPSLEESLAKAFDQRPEYKAVTKKKKIFEERVKIAQGKWLPDVYVAGEYGGRAGDSLAFKENWFFGARLSIPVFDGGLISAEVNRERTELQKVLEEERSLKLTITREVRDAYLNIANARERTEVAKKTIESAKENVRIERLKYQTGAGTNTDYLDAQTDLLRTEADYFRAYFDEEIARASLRKATGEEIPVGIVK